MTEAQRLNRQIDTWARMHAAWDAREARKKRVAQWRREHNTSNLADDGCVPAEVVAELNRYPTLARIMREVAEKHQLSVALLLSHRRNKPIKLARHEAIWRARMETTKSLPQIGRAYNRDHTSCLHAVRMHIERIQLTAQVAVPSSCMSAAGVAP